MELLLIVLGGVVLAAVVALLTWRAVAGTTMTRRPRRAPTRSPRGPVARVSLEVDDSDPERPQVRRLVDELVRRTFARSEAVERVVVTGRSGAVLADVERPSTGDLEEEVVDVVDTIRVPRVRRERRPDVRERTHEPRTEVTIDLEPSPERTFAERFDLPASVVARIREPDDPVDVVRALLDAAGVEHTVRDRVVLSGGLAIVVVDVPVGRPVPAEALTRAFLRFEAAGATDGVALCLGHVSAAQARRRELLAPELRHTGPEAIQRMADAVALGADPRAFVTDVQVAG